MATTAEQAGSWKRSARLVPVPIGRINGDLTLCNYRLAPIVGGKVYCLHVDTAEPFECAFSNDSGCWVESDHGAYAAVGQIISRDGEPEGPYSQYVVAAKVGDDLTVPCVPPGLVPGVPIGCELGGGAVVETAGSASNATGLPLEHHCHLQVCTSSRPHPDEADLVGSAEGPVFCYVGRGAALNDVHGHEADARRLYLPGTRFVHVVWNSGFEVPGAKRPAARAGWPPALNPDSPIAWRPVHRYLKIGSELQAEGGCP
jgi:hypothetical protein